MSASSRSAATTSAHRWAPGRFPRDADYNAADPTTYPTQWVSTLPTFGEIPVKHFATYVQDDWQIARSLTLNLGLRYDVQFGSYNEDLNDLLGRIGEQLGPTFAAFPVPIPFHQGADSRGDRNNLGPRVGLAWDATGDGRTNVHAGYGLFYDNMRTLQNFGELTWPQSRQIIISNPSFPDALQGRSRDQFVSTAPPNITVMDNENVSAYAHQFSTGVSRMIGRDFGVTADVILVNRKSDRDTVDLNLPDQVTRVRAYPQFARVNFWQPTADNNYQALLLKFERRFSGRYQYLASYTLSKSEDDSFQNVYGDRYGFFKETSPGLADRRHRLVVSGIVRLPWEVQLSAIGDFRSSLPMNPVSSIDINADGYANDLPGGVTRFSGCRDLNLSRHQHVPPVAQSAGGQRGRVPGVRQRRHPARQVVRVRRRARSGGHRAALQRRPSRQLQRAEQQHHGDDVRTGDVAAAEHQRAVAPGGNRREVPLLNVHPCG